MARDDYLSLLPRYVDGELPTDQVRLLKDHLPGCDSCRSTIRLLRMEDRAIRSALLTGSALRGPVRPSRRLGRATGVAIILLAVCVVSLYGAYRGLAGRQGAGPASLLERRVLVVKRHTPLPAFLAEVSRRARATVSLTERAKRRLDPLPIVTIELQRPIRLRSLLALLEEFYGVKARVEGNQVHID